jgi:hypothetical protein
VSRRAAQSSAAILESQSVKTADTARVTGGFDSGKHFKGRKRYILVDTLGLLITVAVHAASISETANGELVISELARRGWRPRLIRFGRRLFQILVRGN